MATEVGGSTPVVLPSRFHVLAVAAPVAVVAAVLAARPEIVRGTFSSGASALRVGAVVVGWLAYSWAARRVVGQRALRAALVGVPAAMLLWLWLVPYFQNETVDEAFPSAALPTAPSVANTAPVPAAPPTLPPPVGPAAPAAAPPAVPADVPMAPASTPALPPTAAPALLPTPAPVKISAGSFGGLAGHRGSGEAAIYRQPDGSHFVRLEDFEVSNGPGIVLYLVPGAGRDTIDGGIELGALKGNRGSQNFAVPAGTPLDGPLTILIWCKPFAVPMAGATQSPA